MRKLFALIACFGFVVCAGTVAAQGTGQPTVSSKDANKTDAHDRPIGGVTIKLPAPATPPTSPPNEPPPAPPPPPPPPAPPAEGGDVPPTEVPPDPPPPEDPPTYYGEPVQGKFAFVLDASGSMSGSRMATLRAETTALIAELTEDDELDAVAYGGQFYSTSYTKWLWGSLLPASAGNKTAATSWINGPSMNPGGGTPSYTALQQACSTYPSDLDKMFFVTDGYPNETGSASQILSDFPGWWAKFDDCELICICIGGGGATFMQQLAALAGGSYIAA